MKTPLLLRLASILAALQAAAHATLFLTYRPSHGPVEAAVVADMQAHAFAFGGAQRSYWDMYFGYGLMSAVSVALEVFVLWQLAALAAGAVRVRPIVALFLAANLVHAGLCARYFFLTPIVPDLLVAACLAAALVFDRPAAA